MSKTEAKVNSNFICSQIGGRRSSFLTKFVIIIRLSTVLKRDISIYHIYYKLFKFSFQTRADVCKSLKVWFLFRIVLYFSFKASSVWQPGQVYFSLVSETLLLKFIPAIYLLTLKVEIHTTSWYIAQRNIGSV